MNAHQLTVKEQAMIACMQGLLANPEVVNIRGVRRNDDGLAADLVNLAEKVADELLLRLPTPDAPPRRRYSKARIEAGRSCVESRRDREVLYVHPLEEAMDCGGL